MVMTKPKEIPNIVALMHGLQMESAVAAVIPAVPQIMGVLLNCHPEKIHACSVYLRETAGNGRRNTRKEQLRKDRIKGKR